MVLYKKKYAGGVSNFFVFGDTLHLLYLYYSEAAKKATYI